VQHQYGVSRVVGKHISRRSARPQHDPSCLTAGAAAGSFPTVHCRKYVFTMDMLAQSKFEFLQARRSSPSRSLPRRGRNLREPAARSNSSAGHAVGIFPHAQTRCAFTTAVSVKPSQNGPYHRPRQGQGNAVRSGTTCTTCTTGIPPPPPPPPPTAHPPPPPTLFFFFFFFFFFLATALSQPT